MRARHILCAVATGTVLAVASPASAQSSNYYGDSARLVAEHLACKRFNGNGGGELNLDSGVCWLRGKRVNIITFRGPEQQSEWNGAAKRAFGPHFYWANGKGALVVAKNGNRPAAALGARVLPGEVRHG